MMLHPSCGPVRPSLFAASTPHARYVDGLRKAGLDKTALGLAWQEASALAFADSIVIAPPFSETIYFPAERPLALGYRLSPLRGERVTLTVSGADTARTEIFVDVFELRDGEDEMRALVSAHEGSVLEWVVEKDRSYVVRVQPELLRSARLTINIRTGASLGFPVEGSDSGHIRSFFGNVRDQGRRKHEGVDVFAPRGTPVVAVTKGWASAAQNKLGGKVVWLRNEGRTYYYAHLDSQYVDGLRMVSVGDTLGTVGNTGNAKHTPPHLHFGIYSQGEGAIDPYPYLHTSEQAAPALKADTTLMALSARVGNREVALRAAPNAKAPVILHVPKEHALSLLAASADWFRVRYKGISGYVHGSRISDTRKALRNVELPAGNAIHDGPAADAPIKLMLEGITAADVLSNDGTFLYVRIDAVEGWVLQ